MPIQVPSIYMCVGGGGYGVLRHFQQYFSYIAVVSIIGGVPGENHRPTASRWQTLSHNVV
jgi:hypothetical protein